MVSTAQEVIYAIKMAGLRVGGSENITKETRLDALTFGRGDDRNLAGIEFLCAFERLIMPTVPKRVALQIISRLDNGRGTVADLVAVIDRWRNPPPRPKRAKFQPEQMSLGL